LEENLDIGTDDDAAWKAKGSATHDVRHGELCEELARHGEDWERAHWLDQNGPVPKEEYWCRQLRPSAATQHTQSQPTHQHDLFRNAFSTDFELIFERESLSRKRLPVFLRFSCLLQSVDVSNSA